MFAYCRIIHNTGTDANLTVELSCYGNISVALVTLKAETWAIKFRLVDDQYFIKLCLKSAHSDVWTPPP